jgi:hypothetical protein
MIPALTLVALNAPSGRRATWFALMASLMNVALVAGQLQTKCLNLLFHVDRGAYANLPALRAAVLLIGFVVPVAGVLAFGSAPPDVLSRLILMIKTVANELMRIAIQHLPSATARPPK